MAEREGFEPPIPLRVCVGRLEKLFKLGYRTFWKLAYICQVSFEWGAIRHGEDPIVSLLLSILRLHDFQHTDGFAA